MVIFIHIKIFIIKIVLTILVGVLIVENTKPFLSVYVARRFARLYSSLPLTFLESDLSLIPPIRGIVSLSSRGLRGSVVRLSILPCGFVAGAPSVEGHSRFSPRVQTGFIFVHRRNQWRTDNLSLSLSPPLFSLRDRKASGRLSSDSYARPVHVQSCSQFRARTASSGSYSSSILRIPANTPLVFVLLLPLLLLTASLPYSRAWILFRAIFLVSARIYGRTSHPEILHENVFIVIASC